MLVLANICLFGYNWHFCLFCRQISQLKKNEKKFKKCLHSLFGYAILLIRKKRMICFVKVDNTHIMRKKGKNTMKANIKLTSHDRELLLHLARRISALQDYVDHLDDLSDQFFETDIDLIHFSNELGCLYDQIGSYLDA